MPAPIITATTQAAGLSAVSNLCAQLLRAYQAQRSFELDLIQLARFVLLTIITSPPNYYWQHYLERSFPAYATRLSRSNSKDLEKGIASNNERGSEGVGKSRLNMRNTFTKWFMDCITLGAVFNTVAFVVLMGFMKGQDIELIGHNIRTQTIPIILAGYRIWPLASIVSFSFVPVERRVVFLAFINLIWGIYMSIMAAKI